MAKKHRYFEQVTTPDVQQTIENVDINVYFLDGYAFKHDALKNQLFYMSADRGSISLLLEKQIYEAIPDYYSAQSLLVVHRYFMSLNRRSLIPAFSVGITVTLVIGWAVEFFGLAIASSGLLSLGLGTLSMLVVLTLSFRRLQEKARTTMRESLIELHGETTLNAYLERQEKYMQERRATLKSSGE